MSLDRGTHGSPLLWFSGNYGRTPFEGSPRILGKGFARQGEAAVGGTDEVPPTPFNVVGRERELARAAPRPGARALRRVRERRGPAPRRRLRAAGARARLLEAPGEGRAPGPAALALDLPGDCGHLPQERQRRRRLSGRRAANRRRRPPHHAP